MFAIKSFEKRAYIEVVMAFFFLLIPLFFTNSLFNMKEAILTYKRLLIQNKVKQY